jgi:cytochrome b561
MASTHVDGYGGVAIAAHWLTVVLVVANLLLGLSMVPMPISPTKLQWYIVHKSIGATVFLTTGARLAWRLVRGVPPSVPMPEWQRRAAVAVHRSMYALLIAIPLSGWLYSSSTGVQVVYLGAFPLPDLVAKDRELAGLLRLVHVGLNTLLVTLVAVHVGAALRHYFVDRDAVLARMLPFAKPRGSASGTRAFAALLVAGALLSFVETAEAQRVIVEKSDIRFVSKQMGVNFEGRFRKWNADVQFRPRDLARSKAEFTIDLVSIDLASADSENEAKDRMWFDMATYPVARFVSTSFRSTGPDKYDVAGKLTLKGVTKDIVVPIAFSRDAAGNSVAEGSFVVKRLEFKIGEGLWSDTDTIANEVVVRLKVVMAPG